LKSGHRFEDPYEQANIRMERGGRKKSHSRKLRIR